ncbi:MAG: hypothetical protein ABIF40_05170 [archaeon]
MKMPNAKIQIDQYTLILYKEYLIDKRLVEEDNKRYNGITTIDFKAMISQRPFDELVLRDILDAPIVIYRNNVYGLLILETEVTNRTGQCPKHERPYTQITLTPDQGVITDIERLSFLTNYEEHKFDDHVIYTHVKNFDLELRINFTQ